MTGRRVGRVGGAQVKLVKCIVLRRGRMYTNKHVLYLTCKNTNHDSCQVGRQSGRGPGEVNKMYIFKQT